MRRASFQGARERRNLAGIARNRMSVREREPCQNNAEIASTRPDQVPPKALIRFTKSSIAAAEQQRSSSRAAAEQQQSSSRASARSRTGAEQQQSRSRAAEEEQQSSSRNEEIQSLNILFVAAAPKLKRKQTRVPPCRRRCHTFMPGIKQMRHATGQQGKTLAYLEAELCVIPLRLQLCSCQLARHFGRAV